PSILVNDYQIVDEKGQGNSNSLTKEEVKDLLLESASGGIVNTANIFCSTIIVQKCLLILIYG
ncbi:8582_t:CDS:2, partial [Funneliformis geosporum]